MWHEQMEVYLRLRIAEGKTIGRLLDGVMNGESPGDAIQLLQRLAAATPETDSPTANAISYLGGMCRALDEQEFRTLGLEPSPLEARQTRRQRIALYNRHRVLFEMELGYARKQKAQGMATRADWSEVEKHFRASVKLARAKTMLRLAGWLYRAQLPGAKDLCEAAAYTLFRVIYLPAKKARASASL
jgi:hypothetical protein